MPPVSYYFTTILHVAFFVPAFAVIVAFPAFFAVTTPFAFTVATFVFEEVNVTFLSVAFEGATVALSLTFLPLDKVTFVLLSLMLFTATLSFVVSSFLSSAFFVIVNELSILSPVFTSYVFIVNESLVTFTTEYVGVHV